MNLTLASTSALSPHGLGNLTMRAGASIITDPALQSHCSRAKTRRLGPLPTHGVDQSRVSAGVVVGADDVAGGEGFVAAQQLLLGSGARLQAGSVAQIRQTARMACARAGCLMPAPWN